MPASHTLHALLVFCSPIVHPPVAISTSSSITTSTAPSRQEAFGGGEGGGAEQQRKLKTETSKPACPQAGGLGDKREAANWCKRNAAGSPQAGGDVCKQESAMQDGKGVTVCKDRHGILCVCL